MIRRHGFWLSPPGLMLSERPSNSEVRAGRQWSEYGTHTANAYYRHPQYYNCLLAHKASRSWGVKSAEPAHWGSEYYLEYYSDAGANKCPVDRYVEYGSLKERLARCYAAWDGGGEVAEGFPYWPWSMSA